MNKGKEEFERWKKSAPKKDSSIFIFTWDKYLEEEEEELKKYLRTN